MNRILALTFHGIGDVPPYVDEEERPVWVERGRFEELLDSCAGRDDVELTFDDGNASDVEVALPALLDRRLTATFFVVGDRVGRPGYLAESDLRDLVRAGMRLGCHGMRHRPWRGLRSDELDAELDAARRLLERLADAPVETASCPFGEYDRRVVASLRRAGFDRVYTSDGGGARRGSWLRARTTVHAGDDARLLARLDALEASPAVRALRLAKRVAKRWR